MAKFLQVQRCTLLSIKTGGCPENCNYCSQSSHWSKETGTKAEKLMDLEDVYEVVKYTRFNILPILKKLNIERISDVVWPCWSSVFNRQLSGQRKQAARVSVWELHGEDLLR